METKFILLWLEAPLQSWGYDSKFGRRDTLDFPTKSGVLGLVLCALGASGEQKELLSRFADLRQTVFSYRYSRNGNMVQRQTLLRDFQMIGSGYDDKNLWESLLVPRKSDGSKRTSDGGGTKLTHRYYLQDAIFSVIMEVPADLVTEIQRAFSNPAFPLYLGRRCCVPTDLIFRGVFDSEEDANKSAEIIVDEKAKERNEIEKVDFWKLQTDFKVIDGEDENGESFTLNDVPVQFGSNKIYRDRRVTKISLQEE